MNYNVGDKVRIKSLDWYNENKDELGNVEYFSSRMKQFCEQITIINKVVPPFYHMENVDIFLFTDEMIEGLVEEETEKKLSDESWRYKNVFDHSQYPQSFECPEGYIFKDENGNVINATKIVLEKKVKEYPKTYEECCIALEYIPHTDDIIGYKWDILQSLQKLLICRDAYWKIAGEEKGLGKPWKPDYDSGVDKFGIVYFDNTIMKTCAIARWERHLNKILEFPTEEMRDAFYENFKELIEQCKELL